jgi:hypothetical protein
LKKESQPSCRYSLHYESFPERGWKSRRGPAYYWTADGWLRERSWRAPDPFRAISDIYQYFKSGELLRYGHRNDPLDPKKPGPQGPYEWFDEIFARDGSLIACGYSKMDGAGRRVLACYVLGMEIGYREFKEQEIEFLHRAAKQLRPRISLKLGPYRSSANDSSWDELHKLADFPTSNIPAPRR